jgi:hypothetical protein
VVYVRVLREAGLLTTGARGVNAPAVTVLDAATILLALLVAPRAIDAAGAVRECEGLSPTIPTKSSIPEASIYPFAEGEEDSRNFLEAIALLIDLLSKAPNANEDQAAFARVSFDSNTFAGEIETSAVQLSYRGLGELASANRRAGTKLTAKGEELAREWEKTRDKYQKPRLTTKRTLQFAALLDVAQMFAET